MEARQITTSDCFEPDRVRPDVNGREENAMSFNVESTDHRQSCIDGRSSSNNNVKCGTDGSDHLPIAKLINLQIGRPTARSSGAKTALQSLMDKDDATSTGLLDSLKGEFGDDEEDDDEEDEYRFGCMSDALKEKGYLNSTASETSTRPPSRSETRLEEGYYKRASGLDQQDESENSSKKNNSSKKKYDDNRRTDEPTLRPSRTSARTKTQRASDKTSLSSLSSQSLDFSCDSLAPPYPKYFILARKGNGKTLSSTVSFSRVRGKVSQSKSLTRSNLSEFLEQPTEKAKSPVKKERIVPQHSPPSRTPSPRKLSLSPPTLPRTFSSSRALPSLSRQTCTTNSTVYDQLLKLQVLLDEQLLQLQCQQRLITQGSVNKRSQPKLSSAAVERLKMMSDCYRSETLDCTTKFRDLRTDSTARPSDDGSSFSSDENPFKPPPAFQMFSNAKRPAPPPPTIHQNSRGHETSSTENRTSALKWQAYSSSAGPYQLQPQFLPQPEQLPSQLQPSTPPPLPPPPPKKSFVSDSLSSTGARGRIYSPTIMNAACVRLPLPLETGSGQQGGGGSRWVSKEVVGTERGEGEVGGGKGRGCVGVDRGGVGVGGVAKKRQAPLPPVSRSPYERVDRPVVVSASPSALKPPPSRDGSVGSKKIKPRVSFADCECVLDDQWMKAMQGFSLSSHYRCQANNSAYFDSLVSNNPELKNAPRRTDRCPGVDYNQWPEPSGSYAPDNGTARRPKKDAAVGLGFKDSYYAIPNMPFDSRGMNVTLTTPTATATTATTATATTTATTPIDTTLIATLKNVDKLLEDELAKGSRESSTTADIDRLALLSLTFHNLQESISQRAGKSPGPEPHHPAVSDESDDREKSEKTEAVLGSRSDQEEKRSGFDAGVVNSINHPSNFVRAQQATTINAVRDRSEAKETAKKFETTNVRQADECDQGLAGSKKFALLKACKPSVNLATKLANPNRSQNNAKSPERTLSVNAWSFNRPLSERSRSGSFPKQFPSNRDLWSPDVFYQGDEACPYHGRFGCRHPPASDLQGHDWHVRLAGTREEPRIRHNVASAIFDPAKSSRFESQSIPSTIIARAMGSAVSVNDSSMSLKNARPNTGHARAGRTEEIGYPDCREAPYRNGSCSRVVRSIDDCASLSTAARSYGKAHETDSSSTLASSADSEIDGPRWVEFVRPEKLDRFSGTKGHCYGCPVATTGERNKQEDLSKLMAAKRLDVRRGKFTPASRPIYYDYNGGRLQPRMPRSALGFAGDDASPIAHRDAFEAYFSSLLRRAPAQRPERFVRYSSGQPDRLNLSSRFSSLDARCADDWHVGRDNLGYNKSNINLYYDANNNNDDDDCYDDGAFYGEEEFYDENDQLEWIQSVVGENRYLQDRHLFIVPSGDSDPVGSNADVDVVLNTASSLPNQTQSCSPDVQLRSGPVKEEEDKEETMVVLLDPGSEGCFDDRGDDVFDPFQRIFHSNTDDSFVGIDTIFEESTEDSQDLEDESGDACRTDENENVTPKQQQNIREDFSTAQHATTSEANLKRGSNSHPLESTFVANCPTDNDITAKAESVQNSSTFQNDNGHSNPIHAKGPDFEVGANFSNDRNETEASAQPNRVVLSVVARGSTGDSRGSMLEGSTSPRTVRFPVQPGKVIGEMPARADRRSKFSENFEIEVISENPSDSSAVRPSSKMKRFFQRFSRADAKSGVKTDQTGPKGGPASHLVNLKDAVRKKVTVDKPKIPAKAFFPGHLREATKSVGDLKPIKKTGKQSLRAFVDQSTFLSRFKSRHVQARKHQTTRKSQACLQFDSYSPDVSRFSPPHSECSSESYQPPETSFDSEAQSKFSEFSAAPENQNIEGDASSTDDGGFGSRPSPDARRLTESGNRSSENELDSSTRRNSDVVMSISYIVSDSFERSPSSNSSESSKCIADPGFEAESSSPGVDAKSESTENSATRRGKEEAQRNGHVNDREKNSQVKEEAFSSSSRRESQIEAKTSPAKILSPGNSNKKFVHVESSLSESEIQKIPRIKAIPPPNPDSKLPHISVSNGGRLTAVSPLPETKLKLQLRAASRSSDSTVASEEDVDFTAHSTMTVSVPVTKVGRKSSSSTAIDDSPIFLERGMTINQEIVDSEGRMKLERAEILHAEFVSAASRRGSAKNIDVRDCKETAERRQETAEILMISRDNRYETSAWESPDGDVKSDSFSKLSPDNRDASRGDDGDYTRSSKTTSTGAVGRRVLAAVDSDIPTFVGAGLLIKRYESDGNVLKQTRSVPVGDEKTNVKEERPPIDIHGLTKNSPARAQSNGSTRGCVREDALPGPKVTPGSKEVALDIDSLPSDDFLKASVSGPALDETGFAATTREGSRSDVSSSLLSVNSTLSSGSSYSGTLIVSCTQAVRSSSREPGKFLVRDSFGVASDSLITTSGNDFIDDDDDDESDAVDDSRKPVAVGSFDRRSYLADGSCVSLRQGSKEGHEQRESGRRWECGSSARTLEDLYLSPLKMPSDLDAA